MKKRRAPAEETLDELARLLIERLDWAAKQHWDLGLTVPKYRPKPRRLWNREDTWRNDP